MKNLLIFIIALVLSVNIHAADKNSKQKSAGNSSAISLSGTVSDEKTGELLVGVEIRFAGTDQKTYSDFDGKFSFSNVKPGNYNLVASYVSYNKASLTEVGVRETGKVDIKMQPVK